MTDVTRAHVSRVLVRLSQWVDEGISTGTPPRIAKLAEEVGEVNTAYTGMTGENRRKGVTHGMADVLEEVLDVGVAAVALYEHLTGHQGLAMARLDEKIFKVAARAGVDPE